MQENTPALLKEVLFENRFLLLTGAILLVIGALTELIPSGLPGALFGSTIALLLLSLVYHSIRRKQLLAKLAGQEKKEE